METRSKGSLTLLKTMAALAIIGAINWGLIGFFNFNLVDAIFGGGAREETSTISRIIYALVGLSGLGAIPLLSKRISPPVEHPRAPTAPRTPRTV